MKKPISESKFNRIKQKAELVFALEHAIVSERPYFLLDKCELSHDDRLELMSYKRKLIKSRLKAFYVLGDYMYHIELDQHYREPAKRDLIDLNKAERGIEISSEIDSFWR